ncbi:uncharacterized protein LOC133182445 [Saccostrea echinata]|uniref:uncharacterized protein LOC133182445 n=1 Tax=Saccostrea echinata TaxID=191078 RepID=UPI002A82FAD6|nr:uncharacterized protein LOC133182445 [Saccostrea echinata]
MENTRPVCPWNFDLKMHLLHVLLFVVPVIWCVPLRTFIHQKVTYTSNTLVFVESCPTDPSTREQSSLVRCGNMSYYHCLRTEDGGYVEFCNKSATWIEKGTLALFSLDKNTIVPKPCPYGFYQPLGRWSHESSSLCDRKKSSCNGIGEVVCEDGSMTSDRLCRCDNADDWVIEKFIQENPLNTSCVLPSQTDFMCVKYICPQGQELTPSYMCVRKCRKGYHRPSGSFDCSSVTNISTGNITSSTFKTITRRDLYIKPAIELYPVGKVSKFQTVMAIPIAIIFVLSVSACSILVSKCKKNSSTEKQLQNLAKKKLFERQARKKHRRKMERRKKRQEKKNKLQIKVDKALHRMEERRIKRRERKRLLDMERKEALKELEIAENPDHVSIEMS